MKKLLLLSLVAFYICILLLVNSCDKDIEKVPLNIHVQGLVLQTSDDGFTYSGNVPPEGTNFTIKSSKTLSKITVDSVVYLDENGLPQSSGYWGDISISPSGESFLSNIHIRENTSGRNRTITLKYGRANEYCLIHLLQYQ